MTTMHLRLLQAWRGGGPGGAPGWWLRVEYDEDGVEALKQAVPNARRTWDEEAGAWWVQEAYEPELLRLVPALAAYKDQGRLL